MKAIQIKDGVAVWEDTDFPDPVPGKGELLIENQATALNRADLVQRAGAYAPPPGASPILGLECAGIVRAVGEGVDEGLVGTSVCALLTGGGYAEWVAVPACQALPFPKGMDAVSAASLPEVFATAWLNLVIEAGLQSGEKVLLHAGASGVGNAAIQICAALGAPCYVTVGNAAKLAACKSLGAIDGTLRGQESFAERTLEWTGEKGFQVILDPVGGAYLADNQSALGTGGRLVIIGLMGGTSAPLDLRQLMVRRQRIIGSTLRARPVAEKGRIMADLHGHIWPKLESGEIRTIIDKVFPIEEAEEAHKLMGSNQSAGKIALRLPACKD